jgi:hypothetical protein
MHRRESIMCREFAEAVSELWRTIGHPFDCYRPELYYMRGPGPKWHAKRAAAEIRPLYEDGAQRV